MAQELLQPLSLDQAIALALEHSPRLQASTASVDVMKARLQNTRSVLYPKIDTRFVYPFIGTESGVSVNQRLWDFKRTQYQVQAGKAQIASSAFDEVTQREEIILHTKNAYYTVLSQQTMVAAAEKILQESQKRLEQAEGLEKVGRIPKTDVTRARIQLTEARLQLTTARNNVEKARAQLATVLGLEGALPYTVLPALEYQRLDLDLEAAIQEALQQRPELQSLAAKEQAMAANVLASRQDHYPVIFGRLEYRIEGEGANQPGFIVGVGVRHTLFEGFAGTARVNEARANLMASEAEVAAMRQQIIGDIRQAYLGLQLAEESIPLAASSRQVAQEGLTFVQERYRLGRASAVELAEAEALLATTQANYAQAVYNYKIALAQLERTLGRKLAE